jgi:hypothetical protein
MTQTKIDEYTKIHLAFDLLCMLLCEEINWTKANRYFSRKDKSQYVLALKPFSYTYPIKYTMYILFSDLLIYWLSYTYLFSPLQTFPGFQPKVPVFLKLSHEAVLSIQWNIISNIVQVRTCAWAMHSDKVAASDMSFSQCGVIEFLVKEKNSVAEIYGRLLRAYGDACISASSVIRWEKHFIRDGHTDIAISHNRKQQAIWRSYQRGWKGNGQGNGSGPRHKTPCRVEDDSDTGISGGLFLLGSPLAYRRTQMMCMDVLGHLLRWYSVEADDFLFMVMKVGSIIWTQTKRQNGVIHLRKEKYESQTFTVGRHRYGNCLLGCWQMHTGLFSVKWVSHQNSSIRSDAERTATCTSREVPDEEVCSSFITTTQRPHIGDSRR